MKVYRSRNWRRLIAAMAIVGALGFMNTRAEAGGFLADTFIRPFSPEAADAADDLNDQWGNPVDHGIAAGAEAFVPGAGTAMEAYWAAQRAGMLPSGPGNGFRAAQPQLGNFCSTPAGRFGPGPVNPLGMQCFADTPYGRMFGQVTL